LRYLQIGTTQLVASPHSPHPQPARAIKRKQVEQRSKRIDNEVQFKKQRNEEEKVSVEKKGDANKILTNPGSISYDDVKAFLEKQRLERFNK
jgi:hypothetical protein